MLTKELSDICVSGPHDIGTGRLVISCVQEWSGLTWLAGFSQRALGQEGCILAAAGPPRGAGEEEQGHCRPQEPAGRHQLSLDGRAPTCLNKHVIVSSIWQCFAHTRCTTQLLWLLCCVKSAMRSKTDLATCNDSARYVPTTACEALSQCRYILTTTTYISISNMVHECM